MCPMMELKSVTHMGLLRNPRHEKFTQLVASGIMPSEAYVSVGYKPTGAKQAASRLLTKLTFVNEFLNYKKRPRDRRRRL